MGLLFKNDLHDEFGSWALGYIPYGGADFGDVITIANTVGDGEDAAFHQAWIATGDRYFGEAQNTLAKGHTTNARALFLKASCFYALSYHPLYGEPVDPRLVAAFDKQMNALQQGLALSDPPIKPLRIPYEGTTLPAYLIPAAGYETQTRPLIIFTNGYDGSLTDLYFASAVAASRRGYHSLIFDGPGQGEALIKQNMRMRPDWENVVTPVVDFAITLAQVDPKRIALCGWSLGGYLALRAASGEPRIAACIADPGLLSMAGGFKPFLRKLGIPDDAAADLGNLDDDVIEKISSLVSSSPKLTWRFFKRGYWVQGVTTMRDFLTSAQAYSLEVRIGAVQCPTLLTRAENDPLSSSASLLYEELNCPKSLIGFTAAEGAGDHCEMQNRSLLNGRVLDWLDDVFQPEKPI